MERKIRILHIAQSAGGVKRYIQMLVKYLDHTVFENYLLVSNDTDISTYTSVSDHVEQIDMRREIGLHDVSSIVAVRKVIRRTQPDIIYAHSSKAGALARLANLGLNRPCIYNPHGWAFNMKESPKKQKLYAVLERVLTPLSDEIICISNTEKKSALQNRICSESKITVIQSGIDLERFSEKPEKPLSRNTLHIPENAFIVGMVGRLAKQKAPDVFVEMAKEVLKNIPEAYFLMVGDGELRQQTEAQIAAAGMKDRFYITGWTDTPQDYVNLFDVAVLLSRWEGFGLVLPEYMLAGKPIVAAKVDAIPELIQDRVNGLLVEPEAPRAACDAVYELYRDAELREKFVRQGALDVYEKYDVKRVAEAHKCLFQRLAETIRE